MHYEIIAVHATYIDHLLTEIAVVWVSNKKENWVRGSVCNTNYCSGYKYLHQYSEDKLSEELIQEVAGLGMNLPDEKKEEYFPLIKDWEK